MSFGRSECSRVKEVSEKEQRDLDLVFLAANIVNYTFGVNRCSTQLKGVNHIAFRTILIELRASASLTLLHSKQPNSIELCCSEYKRVKNSTL